MTAIGAAYGIIIADFRAPATGSNTLRVFARRDPVAWLSKIECFTF
jgi:hypothetical protein